MIVVRLQREARCTHGVNLGSWGAATKPEMLLRAVVLALSKGTDQNVKLSLMLFELIVVSVCDR